VQTRGGRTYTELFQQALDIGKIRNFDAAVAYATIGGVKTLMRTLQSSIGQEWDLVTKRWLVGIDWCRTDPPALRALQSGSNSTVKIPNGKNLVAAGNCSPRDTFHPKLFILKGDKATSVVCGSGNLSANGLLRGCECGNLSVFANDARENLKPMMEWYHKAWGSADDFGDIAASYEAICRERVRNDRIVAADDDTKPPDEAPADRRSLTEDQIRELRTFDNFWIDAGALGANLGAGIPGNQLDMKRFSRAFFGADIENLAPNTEIDQISLIWDGERIPDRTLKYGDNHMDKLNIPPAGDRGKMFYRDKALLFRRATLHEFEFHVGDRRQRAGWRRSSKAQGVLYRLSPTREWGLF